MLPDVESYAKQLAQHTGLEGGMFPADSLFRICHSERSGVLFMRNAMRVCLRQALGGSRGLPSIG